MTLILVPDPVIVASAAMAAATGEFDGRDSPQAGAYLRACRHLDNRAGTLLIYTRDSGHHSSGWFKNPDFERCLHLSLSFVEPWAWHRALPHNRKLAEAWARAFWGDRFRWSWGEPPVTPDARRREVWHYRLFCDEHWRPIKPRGEVYSTEFTARGWKSASELWGAPPPESPLYPG